MNENFNNIGSDFDDLFDESSATTVENPVDESQEKAFEIPDMDDYGVVEEPEEGDNPEPTNDTEEELDVWHQYLRDLGVSDSKAIQFENEEGEIETVDFDTLDRETQLTMLKELADPGLSEHEIQVVNYLRQNNASFDDVINYFAEQRLQEYLAENPDQVHQKVYSIDEYTNDEKQQVKTALTNLQTLNGLLDKYDKKKKNKSIWEIIAECWNNATGKK
jgi:hypothetical protein